MARYQSVSAVQERQTAYQPAEQLERMSLTMVQHPAQRPGPAS